ncbi:MAG: MiaB/RimO family radical SAM methylthiotransferase, partial [Acidobacteriota bacterium]|nr:MiaB/RimO family radical SAM methylthiotransferase [Acidobacteriota bacterium]
MSFHIENFGCRAARADAEAIRAALAVAGHGDTLPARADLILVNTCSVTAEADRAARAYIRRAHLRNPGARIVVTGCYAQRAPNELAALPGVAAVIGNSHKAFTPAVALDLLTSPSAPQLIQINRAQAAPAAPQVLVLADDRFAHSFLEEAPIHPGAQTRPNLKIQEGCGNRCSFCVIPETRGPSRSLPAARILTQVRSFVAAGGRELVFSGINLGRWGRDLRPEPGQAQLTLPGLIRQVIEQTGLPLLRLSSIEPMDWDDNLIALLAEYGGGRLARHAHLPLQSGSDAVLRRMYRRYRPWHYAQKVESLVRAAGPALTLGADVMAGFPGETDREFAETLDFIRTLPFGYLHLFPFSPRPNTRAWALHAAHPVPPPVVEERMATLRQLAHEKQQAHCAQFLGATLSALTLHTPAEVAARGRTLALTENFLPIEMTGDHPANQPVTIRAHALNEDGT